ncbi:MAG TPA: PHP-associated domain-containing protein [Candidatus Dormibacteraeota bacterium]|nr:PHP-associated domain-containing protein [Candidatus Dormibacteraeota bacterium]
MKSWSRADLHMHTNFSDGWPSPADLVGHVISRTDLRVIAVTDHDTIEGALRAAEIAARLGKVEVVVGEEVSSRDGHILGLFLERRVRPGMSAAATLHAIHDQGGLAVAPHPMWRTKRQVREGGVVHGVGWLAAELDFDAVEVENATPGFYVFNRMARRLNLGLGAAETGSSDAHILDAIGRAFTEFRGRSAADLRRAIEAGETAAGRSRYKAVGLVRYAAWGFNHQRYAVAAVR